MNEFLLNQWGTEFWQEHFFKPSMMQYTHTHYLYELYFCPQKIAQTSVINGVTYTYDYPCAILSSPYTVHAMSCNDLSVRQFERYVFYFDDTLFETFGKRLLPAGLQGQDAGLLFALSEGQGTQLKRMLDICHTEHSLVEQELTFVLFLNRLVDFCPPENVIRVGTASFYLRDVLRYISETVSEPMDIDRVAKHFAVSRSKLERDFKRFTGITVHAFADICRFNQARYLLQHQPKLSVRAVAEQCGFESETYFFPFFKKYTGMTPAEFRKADGAKFPSVIHESNRLCGE